MGSFNVATNGNYASVSDLNQFVDCFNGTSTTIPLTVLGTAGSQVPFVCAVPAYRSGALAGFYEGTIAGDTGLRTWLGYDGANTGWGTLSLGNGTASGAVTFTAGSSGWTCTAPMTIAGATTVSGTTTCGNLTVNGNMTVTGSLTGVSGQSVTQIQAGGVWKTSGPSLSFDDDSSLGRIDVHPTTGSRRLGLQSQDATGGAHNAFAVETTGVVTFYTSLGFTVGSYSSVTTFSGTGSGTYSHGTGTASRAIYCEQTAGAFEGVDAYNIGTSTCTVNSSNGAFFAMCFA